MQYSPLPSIYERVVTNYGIFLSLSNEYYSRYDCTVCVLMMTRVQDLLLHVMNSSHADKLHGTKCVSYSCLASLSVKQIKTGVN